MDGHGTLADMTTSADPFDPTASTHRPLRIQEPGDLLAAVPALLGFRPEQSVILVCLGGDSGTALGAVLRHDLLLGDPPEAGIPAPMTAVFEQFAAVCARERARRAIAVLVDAHAGCAPPGVWVAAPATDADVRRSLHVALVDALAEHLADVGAQLTGVHVTAAIEAGQPWWSLLGDVRGGTIPDPAASTVAVAHVLGGRQIHRSRAELTRLIGRDGRVRAVARQLRAARAAEPRLRDGDQHDRHARKKLEFVLFECDKLAAGESLSPSEFAALAIALEYRVVRDAVMALSVGERRVAAEALWLNLTRVLPDPERADAATLLGYSAYVRGDGPLAGIAFAAALDSDPEHRLAGLLDACLQGGLRPEAMRELADTGYEQAARLGVALPTAVVSWP